MVNKSKLQREVAKLKEKGAKEVKDLARGKKTGASGITRNQPKTQSEERTELDRYLGNTVEEF